MPCIHKMRNQILSLILKFKVLVKKRFNLFYFTMTMRIHQCEQTCLLNVTFLTSFYSFLSLLLFYILLHVRDDDDMQGEELEIEMFF